MPQTSANLLDWIRKSDNLQFSLERALSYAQERSHPEVTLEHLLLTLTDDPIAAAFLEACGVDVMVIRADALNYIDKQLKPAPGLPPPAPEASHGLLKVMAHAAAAAEQSGRPITDGAIVLAALIGDGESQAARILKSHGLTFEVAIDRLRLKPGQSVDAGNAKPPQEFGPPNGPLPSGGGAAIADPLPPATANKDSETTFGEIFSGTAPQHSPGAHDTAASGSGSSHDQLQVSAPVEKAAGKTDRRTIPTTDEIQSSVSNLIAESRENAESARSKTKSSPHGTAEAPPQGADTGNPQNPNTVVPLPSPGAAPEIGPPGDGDRVRRNRSSSDPQTEPENSGPPRRPGVSQWPFAWQEASSSALPNLPPSQAMARPDPAATPPVHKSTERFQSAPAQDNRETGRFDMRPPAKHATSGRAPSPSQTPGSPVWTPILPAEERKPDRDAAKAARNRAGADRSRIQETIPRRMRTMAPKSVEVTVGRINFAEISVSEEESWRMERRQAFITEAMSVQLKAPDGGFLIENKTPETQWIDHRLGLIREDLTSWQWTITPTRAGRFRLQIIVSARTINEHGAVAESSLPERIVKVRVWPNFIVFLRQFAGLAAAAALGGALARYGEEIWRLGRNLLDIIP